LPDEEQLIIALGFWDVVTEDSMFPLSPDEKTLFDFMYGRVGKTALGSIPLSLCSINQFIGSDGWFLIFEAAGAEKMVEGFENTINKLRKSLPGVKIGLAVNDIIHLNRVLKTTGIYDKLDFVLNSALINCEFPEPDYIDELKLRAGEGRILMVNDYFPTQFVPGIEKLVYDNRLTKTELYQAVMEYLQLM
jgi:hypothetical protein